MTGVPNGMRAVLAGMLVMTVVLPAPAAPAADAAPADAAAPQDAAKQPGDTLSGPNAVSRHVQDDAAEKPFIFDVSGFTPLQVERDKLYDRTGLHLGLDYNSLYFVPTDSLGEDTSGSGVFRLFAKWDLLGRGTTDTGSLVAKGGNRHSYTELAPTEFAPELGYAGALNLSHSDQGWRMTNLYWRQTLFGGRFLSYLGFVDVTDYTDLYEITSYYTNFSNLVFGTGSGTVGGLPDGALGAMAGAWLTEHFYAVGGIADANANQTALFQGFDTFFDEFDTFKSFEVGWTPAKESFLSDNVHLMLYQIDASPRAGTPDGWGVSGSAVTKIRDSYLLFLRGGWGKDGGSPLEASVSTGVGYEGMPAGGLVAVGLNWGRPNRDTYGTRLGDQFTSEIFYRLQVTRNLQVTPSVQVLGNPALNPDTDMIAVFGLRGRIAF